MNTHSINHQLASGLGYAGGSAQSLYAPQVNSGHHHKTSGDGLTRTVLSASSMQIFERSLTQSYASQTSEPDMTTMPVGSYTQVSPISAETAAGNILNSITRRLNLDLANGADAGQLQSRLDAGLEGFQKGFDQAVKDLKDLGLLTPDMEAEIGKTHDFVTAGVDLLRDQIAAGEPLDVSSVFSQVAAGDTAADDAADGSGTDVSISDPQSTAPVNFQSRSRFQQENREFSFALTTADGDTVTIRFSQLLQSSDQQRQQKNGDTVVEASAFSSRNDSRFQFEVDGNLDEGEIGAINDLLGQLKDLSASFFNGDISGALAQAGNLSYDSSEISAFNLDLQQTQVQKIKSAYGQVPSAGGGASDAGNYKSDFQRLLSNAIETASAFQQPDALLEKLSELYDNSDNPGFSQVIKQILSNHSQAA